MTRDPNSGQTHDIDRWMIEQIAALHDALDDVLDVDTGLREARLPGLQAHMTYALDRVLNVDAGLNSILPQARSLPDELALVFGDEPVETALGTFARDLAQRPIDERLRSRNHLPLAEVAFVEALALSNAQTLQILILLNRDPTRFCDHNHAIALGRSLNVARARDRALSHKHGFDLDHALDGARGLIRSLALARDHGRALDLARDLARIVVDALERSLGVAHALGDAHTLAGSFDRALTQDRNHVRGLDRVRTSDLGRFSTALVKDLGLLRKAITDVTGANLTEVDFRDVLLEGLRWSDATRWPPKLRNKIIRDSVKVEAGLYEIRGDLGSASGREPARTPSPT